MPLVSFIKALLPDALKAKLRASIAYRSIRHVYGPRAVNLAPNEAAVCCVVRNGEFYVDQFIQHYSQLGFRHVFLLDNGSSDRTVLNAKQHANVTIYHSDLPVQSFQGLLKRHLAQRVIPAGWCLDVDIDEFFDYPLSDAVPLPSLLEYLNRNGYTALITQMLDMFSEHPLEALLHSRKETLHEVYRYYDLSNVRRVSYRTSPLTRTFAPRNLPSNPDISLTFGGIRKTLYGLDCLLTKHSLFRTGIGIELFNHVHFIDGARLADISAVLLHYKFTSNAFDSASQNSQAFSTNQAGYENLMKIIRSKPEHRIMMGTSAEYHGAADLLPAAFLSVSKAFCEWVRRAASEA